MVTLASEIDLCTLKRTKTEIKRAKIQSSKDAEIYIRQFYGDDLTIYESFFILLLNRANTTIGYAKISQGGIVGTVVDVRLIAKYAIESLCSGIILAHNHPSSNKNPSDEDIKITERAKNALKLFDVKVLDHIILTEDSYSSMADEGIL